MKKLLFIPALALMFLATSCGDAYSDLEGKIDDYCACMKEDPTKCEDQAKAVDEAGEALGKKLQEETKDDEDKKKEAMEKMGKLFKKFGECNKAGDDKKEE